MPCGTAEIVGILLAAGRGRRFGGDKLQHLLPDGRPLAVAAADHLRPACDRLIAVLRPGSEALGKLLGAAGCETLVCADADLGMGHSLAAAIRATSDAAGWVVALADMPFIATGCHQKVAAALRNGASLAATARSAAIPQEPPRPRQPAIATSLRLPGATTGRSMGRSVHRK